MAYVKVIALRHTKVTRERNTKNQWDCDDLSHSLQIQGICRSGPVGELSVDFELIENNFYYLVTVTYSTGSSFHREDGCTEHVALFEDERKARELCHLIIEDSGVEDSEAVFMTGRDGVPQMYFTSTWKGPFDQFQTCVVTKVKLEK